MRFHVPLLLLRHVVPLNGRNWQLTILERVFRYLRLVRSRYLHVVEAILPQHNMRISLKAMLFVLTSMMTSSNGNIFRVTGHLCGEFTGPGEFPAQWPVTRSLDVSLICAWINDWVNNREAGDLRRHRGHYDVNVIMDHRISMLPVIVIESMVTCTCFCYTRDYLTPGICGLIKPVSIERSMSFPEKMHAAVL